MSGHEDWCDKFDDPKALALWKSGRPAALEVVCGVQKHRLALVFDISNLGGFVLCQPPFKALQEHLEHGEKRHGLENQTHGHAAIALLPELQPSDWQLTRCRCGLWWYTRSEMEHALAQRPTGTGRRELVANFLPSSRDR